MPKSYLYRKEHSFSKGKDSDRIDYIRLLVEDQLMSGRDDFSLCRNDDHIFYLFRDEILKFDVHVLDATEIESFEKSFTDLRIKEGALSPQESSLKENITNVIKSHIPERRKESRPKGQKWQWKNVSIILLIAISLAFSVQFLLKPSSAKIIIQTNIVFKRVLLNGLPVHTTNNEIIDLDTGKYKVTLIAKDDSKTYQEIQIDKFKSYPLIIYTQKTLGKKIKITGVTVTTNMTNFNIKIDSIVYPYAKRIDISAGTHTIRVIKEGYLSEPAFRSVYLSSGEVISVPFHLIKKRVKVVKKESKIFVKTNQLETELYLNGKKYRNSGSYTFTDLSLGIYRIQALKAGYWSEPSEHIVRITKASQSVAIQFKLKKNTGNVSIYTLNQQGTIFINGKSAGKGQLSKLIPIGNHTISFSDIEGYHTPVTIKKTITVGTKEQLIGTYLPIILYVGTFNSNGFTSQSISTNYGHVKHLTFKQNSNRPIEFTPNGAVFSYPNQYNNPIAGHAVRFIFNIPETFESSQKLSLKLELEKGKKTYSISNKVQAEVSIIVNNRRKFMNQSVDNTTLNFPVNDLLVQGINEVLIFLTDNNNIPITFKSVRISK
jgi:hypothetical protein